MSLLTRAKVAQSAIDRFLKTPFEWGSTDCVQLVAFVLVGLGYDNPIADVASYDSALTAKREMAKAGITDFPAVLDKMGFERIAPAAALACDIVCFPGEHDMVALGISVGEGRVIAFGNGYCDWAPVWPYVTGAWRVTPKAVS